MENHPAPCLPDRIQIFWLWTHVSMPHEDHHYCECPHIPLRILLYPTLAPLGTFFQIHHHGGLSLEEEVVVEVMEGPMATLPADFDLVDDNFFALHMVDEGDVGGLKTKVSKILAVV